MVTTASCTPRMRSAGMARIMPTATATAMPRIIAMNQLSAGPLTGKGLIDVAVPSAIIRAMKKAATPARPSWASEICPT